MNEQLLAGKHIIRSKTEDEIEAPIPAMTPPIWLRTPGLEDDTLLLEPDEAGVSRRPASTDQLGFSSTDSWSPSRSFDELFISEPPPLRPQTPGPVPFAQPRPMRKSSEAVAIDKLFECLGQDVSQKTPPHGANLTSALGSSPLIKQHSGTDDEEIFQADLANVLVWFEKSLTSSQRITTAFTLFERLNSWQREFVLGMLRTTETTASVRSQVDERINAGVHNMQLGDEQISGLLPPRAATPNNSVGHERIPKATTGPSLVLEAPPGFSPTPFYAGKESQMSMPSLTNLSNQSTASFVSVTSTASWSSCTSAELTLEQCHPDLFKRDIPQWLRSLRLHKYTPCLGKLSRAELLAMDDADLERLGVAALGARRKLLRLFFTIKASIDQSSG